MRNWILRLGPLVVASALLLAVSPVGTRAQVTVLNYFDQADANGNNVLNLTGDGALKFDSKLTDIDHGAASLNASGHATVTTNLTSIVDCTLTLKRATVPTITTLTAIFTTGSGVVEILAWQPTSSSVTTLIPAAATSTVAYVCMGT